MAEAAPGPAELNTGLLLFIAHRAMENRIFAALAQAGFDNVVAPLGTALTENQLELLWRMTPEPLLCFDGDQAGLKAAWRAADLALPMVQPGRSIRFALLPERKAVNPDRLDMAGAALLALGLLALVVPLIEGRERGWPVWSLGVLALAPS